MSKKRELYYSGVPIDNDPRRPLPGEVSPARRRVFWTTVAVVGALALGVLLGLWLAPDTPGELRDHAKKLEEELMTTREKLLAAERTLVYRETEKPIEKGKLAPELRRKHELQGQRYADMLHAYRAQGAAELVRWFVKRWNDILDQPQPDDRVGRRAATLSLLVGGMAENMRPEEFVTWQASFFSTPWLGELHFDVDGDGLPGKRSAKNPKDGFANVSVCQIAMAINQAVTDAQVLVMPDMRCDRPESRMSLFLQGSTFNDAIDEFIRAVEQEGFIVVQRKEKGQRLVLVGTGRTASRR